jgi:hypothetical protein
VLRSFSSILHGEQGALNLSASLCHVLKDQGAQEYAANQTREEARHVTAFAKYIKARWGKPVECGPALKTLLVEIIGAPEVYKKIIGMQMLVEGLAMGAFATFFNNINDPVGKRLLQLVMTDEAFHHKFGKIWADRTVPKLTPKSTPSSRTGRRTVSRPCCSTSSRRTSRWTSMPNSAWIRTRWSRSTGRS